MDKVESTCVFWFWPFRRSEARNCPPVFPGLHLTLAWSPHLQSWGCLTIQQSEQGTCCLPQPFPLGFGVCVYPPRHCARQEHRPLERRPASVQSSLWGSGPQAFRRHIWSGTGGTSRPRTDFAHLIIWKPETIMSLGMCISQLSLQEW